MSNDSDYLEYPHISWNKEELEESLKKLADYAIAIGEKNKGYYVRSSAKKRTWAKALRIIAIMAGAIGGLLPILSQISKSNTVNGNYHYYIDPAWATVAITVAITAIGFDRFFGYSTGWMRFVTTGIKIDSKIEQLRLSIENEKFSWQGVPPDFDKAKTTLGIIVTFLTELSEIVKDETNTWVTEFQNVIQKFNEEMNVKAESSKLGGIKLTIENGDKCNEGLIIHLEGQQPVKFHGSSYSYNNLFPKIYRLSVSGTSTIEKDGATEKILVQDETLVNVTPGSIIDTTLKLK